MIVERLQRRVSRSGSSPLIINYDLVADTRVELSAATFANWVDKTVHLIETLGLAPGDPIALPLLDHHPGHWVSLVWVMAVWQHGSPVASESDAELVVVGPVDLIPRKVPTVACSLHPLGLGLPDLDPELTDYREVLAEPDIHLSYPGDVGILADRDLNMIVDRAGRLLLPPPHDPVVVVETLIAALAAGSIVLVRGGNPDDWRALAKREHAELA